MAGTTTKHSSTFPGNPFFFFPQPNMERVIKARLRGEKSERVASRFRESAEKAWTFFFFFYPDIALPIRRVVRFLGTNGRPVDRSTNYTNEDPRNVQRQKLPSLLAKLFFFPTWPKTFYFSFFRKHDFTFSPRVFLENFLFFLLDNFDENLGNCSLASYMRRRRKILKSRWSHISKPRQQPPSRCRTARSRERVKRTQTE